MTWVKWKDKQGVRLMGNNTFNPPQPWGPWTRIMGVVARCEGNHDTTISYDGTGITWGFMQWTFTSGRLQKLLQYFHSVDYMDFEAKKYDLDLFSKYFIKDGKQIFEKYGFKIIDGKFYDLYSNCVLDPSLMKDKRRIDDICMGRVEYKSFKDQQKHATNLADEFFEIGKEPEIAFAQIEYAKGEFKRSLDIVRSPLGSYKTFSNLLEGTWDTYIPAIFFNLWQNSPAAAYKLFISAKSASKDVESFKRIVWNKLRNSKFANWSYAKSENKSPRIVRISKAIKEFYDIDLPVK